MDNQKRASLGLIDDDENGGIDLAEFAGMTKKKEVTDKDFKAILKAGEKTGFVRRLPVRRRKSPYTTQFGGKCREGMKPLFQELAARLDLYETQALERAILALIEKEGFEDLKAQYTELVK